jgi:hypothetical protein
MSKFTQGEMDTIILATMTFMRQIEGARAYNATCVDTDLFKEMQHQAFEVLASKPDYAYFYLTQDEREEYGGQQ